MKQLKFASVLLSAIMCASMVMTPVSVIADEASAPEETQVEETEKQETEEAPYTCPLCRSEQGYVKLELPDN